MGKSTVLWLALFALALAAGPAGAEADHLHCYQVKDELRIKGPREPWLSLDGEQFGQAGCKIAGRSRLFCAPVEKSVIAPLEGKTGRAPAEPLTPTPLAGPTQQDMVCYKIKCPRPEIPPQEVTDQFGQRQMERFKSSYLCGPAAKTCNQADLVVRLPNATRVSCPGGQGTCVHEVDLEVENVGAGPAGPTEVAVDTHHGLSTQVSVPGLAAGATANLTATLGPGDNCYNPNCEASAEADSLGDVNECDGDNNGATRLDIG